MKDEEGMALEYGAVSKSGDLDGEPEGDLVPFVSRLKKEHKTRSTTWVVELGVSRSTWTERDLRSALQTSRPTVASGEPCRRSLP